MKDGSSNLIAPLELAGAADPNTSYWEGCLADAPALELPTDWPRPATLGSEMGVESCEIGADFNDVLRRQRRECGAEAQTAALAVFALLLHRYSGQERIVIAVHDRDGQFLPIAADFSGRPTFRDLLLRVEAAVREVSQAGAVPADLPARLGIERDASRHAIFQAVFAADSGEEPFAFSSSFSASRSTGLDLYLEFAGARELCLRLGYNEALFEPSTAARMLGHWRQLLARAFENPDRSCDELQMLTDGEQHELVVERNQAAREFPPRCLHELIEEVAAKFPNEVAAEYARQRLTYDEFNARANQMAHYLCKQGIGRNDRVGICLPRSLDFAVAILAVLKAGGTCVPLDPKYPGDRLTFMLEDVAAPVVISERGLLQANVPQDTRVLFVSEERAALAAEPSTNPAAGSNPSDIAYIIYTSGSTGRPRGVLLHHAGLANYARAAVQLFEIRPGDRMLQFCSISFDAALEEIYGAWTAGATLVFREDEVSLEASEFFGWVAGRHITILDLPTAYWHEWVYAMPGLPEKVPSGLRLVIVGGEKASAEAYSTWHRFVGNRVRWINTYGPAEASVVATAYEPKLRPEEPAPAVLPIGHPVGSARVYLLDANLNPVPVGVPGELHIGGIGVAQGYLNQPGLTEQKFISDTFNNAAGSRMYKTGDLAKYLPNGEIEFVGRRDNQVKIRGFRVEPGEIESVLTRHPGVNEAAVILREDVPGNKRLVGYVVRSGQGSATESELRGHVHQQLPEYMVPSEFVFLESMPLTPNGKINRRALSAMKIDSASETARATVAADPVQEQLIKIWQELLGRNAIGVRDNFFDLGGHSLLAARLMHRVKQTFDKTLPLAVLLQAPTIEQLAAVLREGWEDQWSSLVAIQPDGTKPPFFIVHGVGGNVVGFHELGRHMKPDYPFYGLQSQGLSGKHECHARIEDMAGQYLEEIRAVQAKGPYYLGGFSLGGLVAYEMARQLVAGGEQVGLLALFDTYASNPKPANKSLLNLLLHPTWSQVKQLPNALRKKVRWIIRAQRLPEALKKVLRSNAQAAEQYRLQPYSGKAVLLRAGHTWRDSDDPYKAWGQLVTALETIEIPGAHMDILREPHVSHLAERLKDCIDGAALGEPAVLASSAG